MHIGEQVAKLRLAHRESLRQAAGRTGVSHTTIARLETGETDQCSCDTLRKIADGYGVHVEWLLYSNRTGRYSPLSLDRVHTLSAVASVMRQGAESTPPHHLRSPLVDIDFHLNL